MSSFYGLYHWAKVHKKYLNIKRHHNHNKTREIGINLTRFIVIRHLIGLQVVGRQLVPRPMVRQRLVSKLNRGR